MRLVNRITEFIYKILPTELFLNKVKDSDINYYLYSNSKTKELQMKINSINDFIKDENKPSSVKSDITLELDYNTGIVELILFAQDSKSGMIHKYDMTKIDTTNQNQSGGENSRLHWGVILAIGSGSLIIILIGVFLLRRYLLKKNQDASRNLLSEN